MKQYRTLFIAAVALLALGSCSVKEEASPVSGRSIRFTTNLGGYAVKATDTEFESGDEVSLFVGDPIKMYNVKMTSRDAELVPAQDIAWPEGTESGMATPFIAVYPYAETWEFATDANVFSVRPDQTTHAGYTASDLMVASFMAYPDCETVPLNFIHSLCRFDLVIESYIPDEVTEVYLSGVYGKVKAGLGLHAWTETVGETGTVKMGRIRSHSYDTSKWSEWSAILPPQYMSFKILMVTASGKQYTYAIPSGWGDNMSAAHKYQGELTLDEKSEPGDFSVEVSEWTDNDDVQFGRVIADEFHTEGEWTLRRYNPETDTYLDLFFQEDTDQDGRSMFTMYLDNPEGAVYELAYTRNQVNYYAFGFKGETSAPKENGTYGIEIGGTPLSFATAGDLILELHPFDNTLSVREDNDEWSLIGEFYGDEWTQDIPMTRIRAGYYRVTTYYFGEEFKFRCNGSWDVNLGLPWDWDEDYAFTTNPDNGKPVSAMAKNGKNITLEAVGMWVLDLDVHNKTLRAYNFGADDGIFDGYRSFLGNWYFYHDEDHEYSITITDAGTYYNLNFDGVPMRAKYDPVDDGFKVNFHTFCSVNTRYGAADLCFYAETVDEETEQVYGAALGNAPDVTLMKGKLASDGQSITITPGKFDGHPFSYYYIIFLLTEGDYEGQYGLYFRDEFTFPQTWTKVNE